MSHKPSHKRDPRRPGGSRIAALAILCVTALAVGGYLLLNPGRRVSPAEATKRQAAPATPQQNHTQPLSPVGSNYSSAVAPRPAPHYYTETVIQPEESPSPVKTNAKKGRLAIIIDDMGSSVQEARSLAGIGVPLTFSVIPGLRSYREVADYAVSSGIETMIHIPMQSKGWPERRLESNGLLVSMADDAIDERLEEFMRALPMAVGANNHMGSEFTEHDDKMRAVLTALKGKGLFFVDSVTTPNSVGMRVARELNLKSGRRSVFLDNEQDSAYIQGQLNQAVRLAKKNGGVIAICHPHPVTLKTLAEKLPGLSSQGITLVPASQIAR